MENGYVIWYQVYITFLKEFVCALYIQVRTTEKNGSEHATSDQVFIIVKNGVYCNNSHVQVGTMETHGLDHDICDQAYIVRSDCVGSDKIDIIENNRPDHTIADQVYITETNRAKCLLYVQVGTTKKKRI